MKLFEYPVDPRSKISQKFGENPAEYKKFNLLGHNGIDFSIPIGTRIYSCDSGTVREVGSDPSGYGTYIKIDHSWGESIYAHLSSVTVSANELVERHQGIALSGNSGNSTGPHLHFGIRIKPYSRQDGWNGHSDPYPYLIDKDNTSIMGVHVIGGLHKYLDQLQKLQPSIVLVLDPNREEVIELKKRCPNTIAIGRVYKPDSEVAELIKQDPINAAKQMHEATINHSAFGVIDYWQTWINEVCQVDWNEFQELVTCELERMRLAINYKCAIFAFSVGNPDMPINNRMAYWNAANPALKYAEENGHIVALHQYGCKPNIWGPLERGGPDWLIHRLEHQVLPLLKYKKLKFAVTEFGHDYLIVEGPAEKGGYKTREDYKNDVSLYAKDLINIGMYLKKFCGRILGYAIFTLGHNYPWESYDIEGVVLSILSQSSKPLDIETIIAKAGDNAQTIQINVNAALTKAAIRNNLPTQVSPETSIIINGIKYILSKYENINTGESYVYYVKEGDWDNVKRIRRK